MHPNAPWSGRAVATARAYIAQRLPSPCGHCGHTVTAADEWVVGHAKPRALYPGLTWVPSNWRAEHRKCSDRTGQAVVIEKARAEGAAIALQGRVFPAPAGAWTAPPLPLSLPEDPPRPASAKGHPGSFGFGLPKPAAPVEPRADLAWDPQALAAWSWLAPFAEVPEDASPPLYMTRPTDDAVGSYGAAAIEWIEETQRVRLRWWQRLAITRQLEHREDGSLVWRSVVESCPRRAGKSVRIRALALWRMQHAAMIGEVQTVVHCGNDLPICREIQRGAWRWADSQGWEVTKANGKEAIEAHDGSRWLVRSQEGVYGFDAGLAVVDEAWDVKPDTVTEGLEPAMLERLWAQLHLTSTAHRRATSLMKTKISEALTSDDGETLLLLWGAPAGADMGSPEVWRAASPHWSEDRRRMIAAKYSAALSGEADPQADDPDPMQGFAAQYLNMWQLTASTVMRGDQVVTDEAWDALADQVPVGAPFAAAVESWFRAGVSVALAWKTAGRVVVSVTDHADLREAVAAVRASGFRRTATVGASLLEDPAMTGVRARAGQGRTGNAVAELGRLVAEDVLSHDGGAHLTGQVLAARTLPGPDGPRMVSTGRADAVKAAVWAVADCRRKTIGKPRIIVAGAR